MLVTESRRFIGRFSCHDDLLKSLTDFAGTSSISLGMFTVIGALKNIVLGYYDQKKRRYVTCFKLTKTLEIVSCVGNISLNEGKPFVHAHITVADHRAKTYGGHLMPGSRIFAAEYYIEELTGGTLARVDDRQTGLRLWPSEKKV